jgi:hypothetical protein
MPFTLTAAGWMNHQPSPSVENDSEPENVAVNVLQSRANSAARYSRSLKVAQLVEAFDIPNIAPSGVFL